MLLDQSSLLVKKLGEGFDRLKIASSNDIWYLKSWEYCFLSAPALFWELLALCKPYFTLAGQLVSSYCPIEMAPAVALVRFGDPFSAICKSLSNQTEGMGWESPLGSTQLTEGVTSVDLKIDSVTQWEFTPQCYINEQSDGSDEKQCSQGLPVTVYRKYTSLFSNRPNANQAKNASNS